MSDANENNWRFCKRCLIRDHAEAEMYASIKDYLERIDEDIKTKPSEYEKRLSICLSCEKLLKGTCLSCGCFVELRAAVESNHCPSVEHKW